MSTRSQHVDVVIANPSVGGTEAIAPRAPLPTPPANNPTARPAQRRRPRASKTTRGDAS